MSNSSVTTMIANGHHPAAWDEFVGQTTIKRKLKVTAASAALRGARMPHLIIESPEPGVGKTSLALLAASEAGAKARVVTGVIDANRALEIFDELGDGGVLIWDEFQTAVSANKRNIEWLYLYAQHGVFASGDDFIDAPAVTIIAATTHVGDLPSAVKQRFQVLHLAPYTPDEALEIARSTWSRVGQGADMEFMSDDTCYAVARAASGRPRYMQRIWENVRDLAVTGELDVVNDPDSGCIVDLTLPLEWAGLTEDGLTDNCLRYLEFLLKNKQRPRGGDFIARATGIAKSELAEVEALLMEKEFITDTGHGRELTREGKARSRSILAVAA